MIDNDIVMLDMLTTTLSHNERKLHELYHENTKLHHQFRDDLVGKNDPNSLLNQAVDKVRIAELEFSISTGGKKYHCAKHHNIVPDQNSVKQISLLDALSQRLSVREFSDELVSIETLSALFHFSYGCNQERSQPKSSSVRFSPSSGGLYPLEIYGLMANDLNRTSWNLWHYEPQNSRMELIYNPNLEQVKSALIQQPLPLPPLITFITAVLPRLTWKYGERAYRYALLEAGHVGQNLSLVAAALKLGICPIASFYDDAVHDLLDVDGVSEVALYTFFAGY